MKKHYLFLPLAALSIMGVTNITTKAADCTEKPGVCYQEACACYSCLGPDNIMVNAPVRPKTCNGDFVVSLALLFWNSHLEGTKNSILNDTSIPSVNPNTGNIQELNTLANAKYTGDEASWDPGFKIGIGYNSPCDGWDIAAVWTWFRNSTSKHVEAEPDDNRTLIPLWSAFAPAIGTVTFARDIQTVRKLVLNLVDIDLGREFYTSKYLTFRPFVGLRYASIDQKIEIQHKGGSWSARAAPTQDAFNNKVNLKNDFEGVGLRGGFDTTWNLGCGWAFAGSLATSAIYGRFEIKHDERNRQATDNHDKTKILETDNRFHASRAILDLFLGVRFATMFCNCGYGLAAVLGWEHHLFFNQNQMWRVRRIGDTSSPLLNNTGENVFEQRKGNLSTQGWTLKFIFEF